MYDVIVIGAGPAGLFAADRLIKENISILVIDERKYAGGSAINDGKLNLTHKIGMFFNELGISEHHAGGLIQSIDSKLVGFGAGDVLYGTDERAIQEWVKKAASHGIELIPAKQRHMGTDVARRVWRNFYDDLIKLGVNFAFGRRVTDIQRKDGGFLVITKGEAYWSRFLIAAPGRGGSYWFREQAKRLGIKMWYGPIDIGVRVEVPYEVYQPITDVLYDPKFILTTKCHGDRVRTFCTNPRGFVRVEPVENAIVYDGKRAYSLNGHAYKSRHSKNTNFALLHTMELTEPDEDTTEFGRNAIISCYTFGGGKPLVQRLGDLLEGKRSKESTFSNRGKEIKPTLSVPEKATPEDISLAYNSRTMNNLKESIAILGKILPGVTNISTIIYAPEVKFYDTKYPCSDFLETTVKGLFVAGDGSGKSRGIVGAALTGILAAEGILKAS